VPEELSSSKHGESRIFATIVGLSAVMLRVRHMTLSFPPIDHLLRILPILVYQDVLFCSALAWLFHSLLLLCSGRTAHKRVLAVAWSLCFFLVIYTAVDSIVYENIHSPLTYRLWIASDHLRGVRSSVVSALSIQSALRIAKMVLIFACVSEGLCRLTPRLLERIRTTFHSPSVAVLGLLYVVTAHAWTLTHVRYLPAVANFEFAFADSLLQPTNALAATPVSPWYISDFARERASSGHNLGRAIPLRVASLQNVHRLHPIRNVLMIVMESVGSRSLELYGAQYHNTPQLIRLAAHSAVFDRIYVSQPYTSAAVLALFCSLYPNHGWIPLVRSTPNLNVPGLADVLRQHGYRTAFMHFGDLSFDNHAAFLRNHGFEQLFAKPEDQWSPTDSELLSNATSWIRDHSKDPFLLVLWTQDTHHPYFSNETRTFDLHDASHNRYLNAISSTDQLIGRLTDVLSEMKLSDDTLVVITGDHGEAFGEHGQVLHNFTVYDEEVRIPLLLINKNIFQRELPVSTLGRQIDIAPTILAILGYEDPPAWQGRDLLADNTSVERAYLFSSNGDFRFGLVDGNFKYIYNADSSIPEFYDLATDSSEAHDLGSDPLKSSVIQRDKSRVAAWLAFQNKYLHQFER